MILKDEVVKAKLYAFRLFRFRLRAEKELIFRLKNRKFSQSAIDKVVTDFKDQGLIDDSQFVRDWVAVRRQKGFGLRRIELELEQKGITKEFLEENIDLGVSEYSLALKVAQGRKDVLLKKDLTLDKVKQRLFNFMIHRGFSSDTTKEVIEELL